LGFGQSFPRFDLSDESPLSPARKRLFAFAILLLIILAVYSNTFRASWQFDDKRTILQNRPLLLRELNWPNVKKTLFASPDGRERLYRPVSCLSIALNYYFGKGDVVGYHLVNVSIHFVSSILLFLFILNTLKLPSFKAKYGPKAYSIALVAALLWAVNPVQTQAVTYIVQRMAAMAGMFYITAMYFYLKGRISGRRLQKRAFFILCIVSGLLAVGSKENAAMLPFSILLYDLFFIQGVSKQSTGRAVCCFLILSLIPLVFLLLYKGADLHQSLLGGYDLRLFTLGQRLLTEPRVILFYASLLLYPMPDRLCVTHDISLSSDLISPPQTLIALLSILAALAWAILDSRRRPLPSYCILFFLLNHLPEGSVFPLEISFEHRNYIPSMLFFLPIAVLIVEGTACFNTRRRMQAIFVTFLTLMLIGHGHSTYVRNAIWRTEESLWLDVIEKYPQLWRPYVNLGKHYSESGRHREAVTQYLTSLDKKVVNNLADHNRWISYNNIGVEYDRMGREEEALSYLKIAEGLAPLSPDVQNNIGSIHLELRRYGEAEQSLRKALEYNPRHMNALINLASLYTVTGDLERADALLGRSLELESGHMEALKTRVRIYIKRGRFEDALTVLRQLGIRGRADLIQRLILEAEIHYLSENTTEWRRAVEALMDRVDASELLGVLKLICSTGKNPALVPDGRSTAALLDEIGRIKKGN
jgi:Tfp pilus assembly protein PilF